MISKLIRSRSAWAATILLGGFWVVTAFTPRMETIEFLRIVQISVGVVVVVSYAAHALRALLEPYPTRVQQLSMGIDIGFLSLVLGGIWFLLWRMADQPYWMPNSRLAAFFIWLSILAGVLHVTAPGAVNGQVPTRAKVLLGLAVGSGALVFLTLLWHEPDLRPWINALEPWVP